MNFLWAIGLLIASYLIQALITPAVKTPKPALLKDFDFPQFDEGTPQSVVFGDVWMSDWMVLWYGHYRTKAVKQEAAKK